jgi:hypothetical protein
MATPGDPPIHSPKKKSQKSSNQWEQVPQVITDNRKWHADALYGAAIWDDLGASLNWWRKRVGVLQRAIEYHKARALSGRWSG